MWVPKVWFAKAPSLSAEQKEQFDSYATYFCWSEQEKYQIQAYAAALTAELDARLNLAEAKLSEYGIIWEGDRYVFSGKD